MSLNTPDGCERDHELHALLCLLEYAALRAGDIGAVTLKQRIDHSKSAVQFELRQNKCVH